MRGLSRFICFFIFFLCVLSSSTLWAQKLISRQILALYDSSHYKDLFFTPLHQYAEMPLNHLGMDLVYWDLAEGFPDKGFMEDMRGVLTWFQSGDSIKNESQYCSWMKEQIENGKKYVILEFLGFESKISLVDSQVCRDAFELFGLKYNFNYLSDNSLFFELVSKETSEVEFERNISFLDRHVYNWFQVDKKDSKIFLKMRRTDFSGLESDLVFINSKGGFAAESYVVYFDPNLNRAQWHLNPFSFFTKAFELNNLPRPDTNMYNGSRIFYTHIDGDGIFNTSYIEKGKYSSEIILREIINKYKEIPMTVSIIAGYLDKPEYNNKKNLELYQNLFSPAHVEPAVHGYTHPFVWKDKKLALKIKDFKFSYEKEISLSLTKVNALLKKLKINKGLDLFLWTGDCLLSEEILKWPYQFQVLNMNGGDSRFDKSYPSHVYLMPLGIKKGKFRQIYSSAPNENVYTNLWKSNYHGFQKIIDTFKATDKNALLKPINIYYHFYSGEHLASLKALQRVYDYALSQNIFPLFASDYVRLVHDFFEIKLFEIAGGVRVKNKTYLRTIRFDKSQKEVNIEKSKGVLGYKHYHEALYVFLDESDVHDIIFLKKSDKNRIPYLYESNFHIKNLKLSEESISFEGKSWGLYRAVFNNLKPDQPYQVLMSSTQLVLNTNNKGQLHFELPASNDPLSFQKITVKKYKNLDLEI